MDCAPAAAADLCAALSQNLKHVLLEDDEFDAKPGEAVDDDESTAGDGTGEMEQRRERRRKKKEQDGKEESGAKPKRDRKASKGSAAETRLVAAAAEPLRPPGSPKTRLLPFFPQICRPAIGSAAGGRARRGPATHTRGVIVRRAKAKFGRVL